MFHEKKYLFASETRQKYGKKGILEIQKVPIKKKNDKMEQWPLIWASKFVLSFKNFFRSFIPKSPVVGKNSNMYLSRISAQTLTKQNFYFQFKLWSKEV